MVARFYLFRTLVFLRPVHLADLKEHPLQVFELSELREDTGADRPHRASPQVRPGVTQLRDELPDQRQAHPDHVVVVALDAGDERAAEPVDGERAGDDQRLAGRDVRRDLLVADVREVHGGRRGRRRRPGRSRCRAGCGRCAGRPERPRISCQRRTASSASSGLPSAAPSRSSTESQPSTSAPAGHVGAPGHGRALELGELQRQLGRRQPVELRLVDAGHDHDRLDAGAAQGRQAGGRGGGEDECRGAADGASRAGLKQFWRRERAAGHPPPHRGRVGRGARNRA